MDILPALPDAQRYQLKLLIEGHPALAQDNTLSGHGLAITDKTHPQYNRPTDDWPQSNPTGYAAWFRGRMRVRLTEAMESAKRACHRLEEKAIEGAKAADRTIREHPYQSIGVAFGLGLLIGVLVTRK